MTTKGKLGTKQPHKNPAPKFEDDVMANCLEMLNIMDHSISSILHEMKLFSIEILLLPLGYMFSTYGAPLMGTILWTKLIFIEAKLSGLHEPTRRDQAHMLLLITVHMLAVVGITTVLKRVFKRDRPKDPRDPNYEGKATKRMVNLRGPETNHSMPSGDTTQSSQYVTFLALYLPNLF